MGTRTGCLKRKAILRDNFLTKGSELTGGVVCAWSHSVKSCTVKKHTSRKERGGPNETLDG